MLEGDLSKIVKPASQIPINQFWGYADQYFRDLTEEDIRWLQDKVRWVSLLKARSMWSVLTLSTQMQGYDVVAYTIPQLGRNWRAVLQDQDAGIFNMQAMDMSPRYDQVPDDSLLLPGDAYFGPLTERVVAGLQAVGVYDDAYWKNWLDSGLLDTSTGGTSHSNHTNEPTDKIKAGSKTEVTDLEDRIKQELRYLGVIPEEEVGHGVASMALVLVECTPHKYTPYTSATKRMGSCR